MHLYKAKSRNNHVESVLATAAVGLFLWAMAGNGTYAQTANCNCVNADGSTKANGQLEHGFTPTNGICIVCEGGQPAQRPIGVSITGPSNLPQNDETTGCEINYQATVTGGGGGFDPYTYSWVGFDGTSESGQGSYNLTSESMAPENVGSQTVIFTATASNGCFATTKKTVTVHPSGGDVKITSTTSNVVGQIQFDWRYCNKAFPSGSEVETTISNDHTWSNELSVGLDSDMLKVVTAKLDYKVSYEVTSGTETKISGEVAYNHAIEVDVQPIGTTSVGTVGTYDCQANYTGTPFSATVYNAYQCEAKAIPPF